VDLELRPEGDDDRERIRAVRRELAGVPADDRAAVLSAYLAKTRSGTTPGARFAGGLAWLHAALAVAGALLGWGAAVALLDPAGAHPVNVVHFLAVLVLLQIALLLVLALAFVPGRRPERGPLQRLLLGLAFRLVRAEEIREPLRTLAERRHDYRRLERWLLLRSTQLFAVAFNLAALAGCLYRVVFSDVAFAWSTTLQWTAADAHRLTSALSAPWAWLVPDGRPSLALLEATRYSHLEGRYLAGGPGARAFDPSAVGGWWPFLALSLAVYGLLPRLAAWAFAAARVRRALRRAPYENERLERLWEGLTRPSVKLGGEGPAPEPPLRPAEAVDEAPPPAAGDCAVAVAEGVAMDRSTAAALVRERLGVRVVDDGPAPALVLVLPGWEEPIRAHQRQLEAARARLGPDPRLVALLVDERPGGGWGPPPEDRVRRWRRHLRALEDPRLRVESL